MNKEQSYKPVFKYETDESFKDNNKVERAFYLLGEPNTNFPDEIKQLIQHVFNRVKAEKQGIGIYHFNVHDFLQFQQVTNETKQAILDKLNIVLSWYPDDQIQKYKPNIIELIQDFKPEPRQIKNETGLSVPDWAIIFYCIDETGKKQGTKVKRFELFMFENGISTSLKNFKKEYHEIVRRINQKKNSKGETLPPLPPERIEKILPYLKNNKKALELANNEMVYLTNEVNEYKDNND